MTRHRKFKKMKNILYWHLQNSTQQFCQQGNIKNESCTTQVSKNKSNNKSRVLQ